MLTLGTAVAQTAQIKIAYVNVQRLLQEAPQAQAASAALEGEFAGRRRELETQQKDLKAREDKLEKDGAVMAENERRTAEKTLRDGQRELARKQNEFLEDLNVRRNEALGQLQRTVVQEIQTYSKTRRLRHRRRRTRSTRARRSTSPAQVLTALQARGKAHCGHQALSGRQGAADPCHCASPTWRCASAASCAAIPTSVVERVGTLQDAGPGEVAFLANPRYRRHLTTTRASAVVLDADSAADCPTAALLHRNPYATYARIAQLLHPGRRLRHGVHAVGRRGGRSSHRCDGERRRRRLRRPRQRGSTPRAQVGPGCVLLGDVAVGADARAGCESHARLRRALGQRCILHPGVVIGADGFGHAPTWTATSRFRRSAA